MKKTLFLVILLAATSLCVQLTAQNTLKLYTHYCPNSYWRQSVGRISKSDQHIIASHRTNSTTEFFSIDPVSLATYKFDLMPVFWVLDFEVSGEMVYFCGTYHNQAVIGRFNENEFYSGSTVTYEYMTIPQALSLHKMVLYRDVSGADIVAAVGSSVNQVADFIVTVDINDSTLNYCYKSISNYICQDIAVTDNYIVASGDYASVANQFAVTVINKNDLCTYAGVICNETSFNNNTGIYNIKELDGDNVAISTIMDNTSYSQFCARVHVFDAANLNFINTQDIPLINKTSTNEMQYIWEDSTLLLLHTNEYPVPFSNNSVIYYLKPYMTSSYTATVIYDTTMYSSSLDRLHLSTRYLATGALKTGEHCFFMRALNGTNLPKCFEESKEIIYIPNIPIPNPTLLYPMNTDISLFNDLISNLITDYATIHCDN